MKLRRVSFLPQAVGSFNPRGLSLPWIAMCGPIRGGCSLVLCLVLLFFPLHLWSAESDRGPGGGDADKKQRSAPFITGLEAYKKNYVLPLVGGSRGTGRQSKEFQFQFSLKQRLGESDLYFGYTQKSFWQIYDGDNSRPFRESNYNPEFFWPFYEKEREGRKFGGLLGLLEHESNGSGPGTSRSWNRIYVTPYFERKDESRGRSFRVELKVWYRLQEESKGSPLDPQGDDNPDIQDFYGNSELRLRYKWSHDYELTLFGRWNPSTSKGAFQAGLSTPVPFARWDNVFMLFHYWSGYGESLIDYNRDLTRYGIGVILRK